MLILPDSAKRAPSQVTSDDEEPGNEDLRRVERRLRQRDVDAGLPHALRAARGNGRGTRPRRRSRAGRAGRLPCRRRAPSSRPTSSRCARWRTCNGLITKLEQQHEHRHAEQHDEPERHRRREQDDRHHDVGDERAGEACGDVERAARADRVVRDRRDDLAGRELASNRRAASGPHGGRRPGSAGTRPGAS